RRPNKGVWNSQTTVPDTFVRPSGTDSESSKPRRHRSPGRGTKSMRPAERVAVLARRRLDQLQVALEHPARAVLPVVQVLRLPVRHLAQVYPQHAFLVERQVIAPRVFRHALLARLRRLSIHRLLQLADVDP